jgi:hypothetical protein
VKGDRSSERSSCPGHPPPSLDPSVRALHRIIVVRAVEYEESHRESSGGRDWGEASHVAQTAFEGGCPSCTTKALLWVHVSWGLRCARDLPSRVFWTQSACSFEPLTPFAQEMRVKPEKIFGTSLPRAFPLEAPHWVSPAGQKDCEMRCMRIWGGVVPISRGRGRMERASAESGVVGALGSLWCLLLAFTRR